jgi:uncharacterized protein YndB with AHSA1/START domain
MTLSTPKADPHLDLVLERVVDVPRELVWKAWTQPQHLMRWFTPKPWETIACSIDLRPGGLFYTRFRGPDGPEVPNFGCYLEVVENEKLVWTDALGENYRPLAQASDCLDSFMTAYITFEEHQGGTKYTALVLHKDEAGRKTHEERGFYHGWGTAFDQLVAYIKAGMVG